MYRSPRRRQLLRAASSPARRQKYPGRRRRAYVLPTRPNSFHANLLTVLHVSEEQHGVHGGGPCRHPRKGLHVVPLAVEEVQVAGALGRGELDRCVDGRGRGRSSEQRTCEVHCSRSSRPASPPLHLSPRDRLGLLNNVTLSYFSRL
jgi:hypothetical protein